MKAPWMQPPASAHYVAEMPGNVTLCATPDATTHFGTKPKRGTKWHAQASHYDEATRTISRFGREEYARLHDTKEQAMRAAEAIYRDATA